jgi:hypothetical protein
MKIDGLPCLRPPVGADSANSLDRQAVRTREKISRERSIAEAESPRVTNRLRRLRRKPASARSDRSRKGWSPERRARQAALIRTWTPWRRSTGPKTPAGKAASARNALKHGGRSQAKIREYQRIRYFLRLAAQNIAQVRLLIRLRDARPRIKYKFPPPASARRMNTAFPSPLVPLWERETAQSVQPHRCGEGVGRRQIRKPRAPTLAVSASTPRV